MDQERQHRTREEDKEIYRGHVDALVDEYGRRGIPRSRREIVQNLRDKSLKRLTEELGGNLTPRQKESVARYQSIMYELLRECDN